MGWKEKWRGKEGVEGKGKEEEGEQKEQLFMKRRELGREERREGTGKGMDRRYGEGE